MRKIEEGERQAILQYVSESDLSEILYHDCFVYVRAEEFHNHHEEEEHVHHDVDKDEVNIIYMIEPKSGLHIKINKCQGKRKFIKYMERRFALLLSQLKMLLW